MNCLIKRTNDTERQHITGIEGDQSTLVNATSQNMYSGT